LAAPTSLQATASLVASHVDWPSRTLLTVRPARQDAVLLRHVTTTALPTISVYRTRRTSTTVIGSSFNIGLKPVVIKITGVKISCLVIG